MYGFWVNNVLNPVAKVEPVDVEVLLLLHGDVKSTEGCLAICVTSSYWVFNYRDELDGGGNILSLLRVLGPGGCVGCVTA